MFLWYISILMWDIYLRKFWRNDKLQTFLNEFFKSLNKKNQGVFKTFHFSWSEKQPNEAQIPINQMAKFDPNSPFLR